MKSTTKKSHAKTSKRTTTAPPEAVAMAMAVAKVVAPAPPTVAGPIAVAPATENPVGEGTIDNAIERAFQRLELLEWALSARLEEEDYEVFTAPIGDARDILRELLNDIKRKDLAPRSWWGLTSHVINGGGSRIAAGRAGGAT